MSEHCEVGFTVQGERELRTVARNDPERFAVIRERIRQVQENGWHLSVKSELVKVLRNSTRIGEIRDVGSGGYRLIFFWRSTGETREIWVCYVRPKRDLTGRARLNALCDSAEKLRKRFLEDEEEG